MGQNLLLRLYGLNITVLYEGGGGQQVAIPSPRSGRVQRRKEIPEAEDGDGHEKKRRGQGGKGRHKNGVREGKHIKGSGEPEIKREGSSRMHECARNKKGREENGKQGQ